MLTPIIMVEKGANLTVFIVFTVYVLGYFQVKSVYVP